MKTILCTLLVLVLASQVAQSQINIDQHYGICCHIHYIYSLDRSWWMSPVYPFLASPAGFPATGTLLGNTAVSLDYWRRFFDYYMSVHQFTCQNYGNIMNHWVPYFYPGVTLPTLSSFCDLLSNLNHPFNYLNSQLQNHCDHTYFTLFFAATPFTYGPSLSTIINLINTINRCDCTIYIRIYIIRWWFFWPWNRRMLQGFGFPGGELPIPGGELPFPGGEFTFPQRPTEPTPPPSAPGNSGADPEQQARKLFSELSSSNLRTAQRGGIQSVQQAKLRQYETFNEGILSDVQSRLKRAGVQIQKVYIQSESQLQNALETAIRTDANSRGGERRPRN